MRELRPNLWHWTAPHPDWRPATPGSPDDWARDVGCALYITDARAIFVDPLLPSDTDAFWAQADALTAGRKVHVLTTIRWHVRSRAALVARYAASTSRARAVLAPDVVPIPIRGAEETVFWLPAARTLIPGDRLLGENRNGLRLCPASWLRSLPSKLTLAELRARMMPLLELPVEAVLVSHGDPVLDGASAALRAALADTPSGDGEIRPRAATVEESHPDPECDQREPVGGE